MNVCYYFTQEILNGLRRNLTVFNITNKKLTNFNITNNI